MNPILLDLLYAGALAAGSPFLIYKMATGKYRRGLGQRLGFVKEREGASSCIWVHGVSVGEVLASRGLVAELENAYPGMEVAVSTTTDTGQDVARGTFPGRPVFYWPLDFSRAVARAFRRIRPRAVVLMEMEVWPNFMARANGLRVPVIVVNGRVTKRAERRLARLGGLGREFLGRVDMYLVQSDEYAERLLRLGVPPEKVKVAGNVKFDTLSTDDHAERACELRRQMGVRPGETLIIGGSTHEREEEALLSAYASIKAADKRARLLIVPRHNTRFDAVAALIAARGFPVLRRSLAANGARPIGSEVILGDTMGELEVLYEAADVAFVGGTLIDHGGQNMMEPAAKGKPVVFGPSVTNFTVAAGLLLCAGAATRIEDARGLADALRNYMGAPAGRDAGLAGRQAVIKSKGATARAVAEIKEIIGKQP